VSTERPSLADSSALGDEIKKIKINEKKESPKKKEKEMK